MAFFRTMTIAALALGAALAPASRAPAVPPPPPPAEAGSPPPAAVVGRSVVGVRSDTAYAEYFSPDGGLRGRGGGRDWRGVWRIEGDALCRRPDDGPERCAPLVRQGPAVSWDGEPQRVVPGDLFAGPPAAPPGGLSPGDPLGALLSWYGATVVVGRVHARFAGGLVLADGQALDVVIGAVPGADEARPGDWRWARGARRDGVFRATHGGPYVPGEPVP